MKLQRHRHLLAATIIIAGSAVLLAGCMGIGGSKSSTTSSLKQARVATTAESVADLGQEPVIVAPADAYSSFQSKDPFVQQQVVTPTTQRSSGGGTSSGTTPPTSSTTTTTTAPGGGTTTTSSTSTTTTSSSTTSTTSFYTHMMQILAVGVVGDAPAVTFQVDNNVYQDQRIGDSVSTSWGDVKVVGINTDATPKSVTVLHEDKTLTLSEHQILFE
jgi:hypothetical protein